MGSGEEPESDTPDTPEARKDAALAEIGGAMERGILRSELVTLLGDLRTRLDLTRCELVGDATVVVENSDPETIEGVLSFSPEEVASQTTGETFGQPGGEGGGDIVLGEHETQVSANLVTVRGALADHIDDATWPEPHGIMPLTASRPERITASLSGRLDVVMESVPREGRTQRMVGHMGDFERAFNRGIWSSGTFFQGGHIIGHQFGGLETFENLVPMLRDLNNPLYGGVESFVSSVLPSVAVGTGGALPTVMEWEFRLTYGTVQAETVSRLANIVASKFGSDVAAGQALVASIHGPSFRQRVSFPARVPTQIVMDVTLLAGPPPASVPVPGGAAATTGTMPSTRVLDPFIRRRPAEGQPAPRTRCGRSHRAAGMDAPVDVHAGEQLTSGTGSCQRYAAGAADRDEEVTSAPGS